jgi:hypothetical protein
MQHPNEILSAVLPSVYADLLAALARDEPNALRRVARTVQGQVGTTEQASPASQLARAWLAFAGDVDLTLPADGTVFHFTVPAQIAFEVVANGGVAAAKLVARRALAALDASDKPLGGVAGPLPGAPSLVNVTVWAGSSRLPAADLLKLELTDLELTD